MRKIIEKSSEFSPVGVKGSLLAMLGRTDTTQNLGNIKIPTLLVCGEKDLLTPPSVMKEMFHKIPDAEYVEIKNAGHMTPIENPDEVNKAIINFLSKLN